MEKFLVTFKKRVEKNVTIEFLPLATLHTYSTITRTLLI